MFDLGQLSSLVENLSKRERVIFYLSIVFISLALLDRLLISPALTKISSLDKKIEEEKLIIQKDLRLLSLKDKIKKEVSYYSGYLKKEGSPDEEMNSLLKLIEDFARRSSVSLLNIRPSGIRNEKGVVKYYVDLNCEGDMPRIVSFLYNIESAKEILTVEKLNISPKEENSSVALCRITIAKLALPQ